MNEKQIKIKVNEGYTRLRAIVEVIGNPKKYVEDTLKGYVEKIDKEEEYIMLKNEIEPAKEEEGFFVSFAEVEMLMESPMSVLSFCFDYMPSSVEILEPTKLIYDSFDFTGFLNDMQARLHAVNIGISDYKKKNLTLITNTSVMLKNFVIYVISDSSKTLKELANAVGIKESQMEKVVEGMMKEKAIVKKEGKYSRK